MLNRTVIRIHPAINIARLGTSEEYNLSPETSAGLPLAGTRTTGGLPIKPGTDSTSMTNSMCGPGRRR